MPLNVRRFGANALRFSRHSSHTPADRRIRRAACEALEERRLFTAAYALIGTAGTTLVRFDTATPSVIQNAVSISGLQPGETLQGIDFRPVTGVLYALGVVNPDAGSDTARLYTLNTNTGAATQLGVPIGGLADGTSLGFDFNPAADRIRCVDAADQSFRLNPNDGSLAGTDTNLNNGSNSEAVTAIAYDRNDKDPSTPTTLFGIDFGPFALVRIGGVNGTPSPNGGVVTTIGGLGVTPTDPNIQFDIAPDGSAFAIIRAAGLNSLYSINLTTGAATLVGAVGNGADTTRGFAINVDSVANAPDAVNDTYSTPINTPLVIPAKGVLTNDSDPNGDTLSVATFTTTPNGTLAVAPDGSFTYKPNAFFSGVDTFTYKATDGANLSIAATVTVTVTPNNLLAYGIAGASTLVKFLTNAPGTIIGTVPLQGLQPGEKLLGIDFRPADTLLYGLGSSGRVYKINTNTGATTGIVLTADPTDATAPFTVLNGGSFGVDFNPVPDRLRVVSNNNQNLRVNVDTGAVITDDDLNPGFPDVVGAGYLNPDTDPATGTTLYTISRTTDALNIQNPPNNGTQVKVGAGLGVDIAGDIGFDVARDGRGFLAATDDANDLNRFYTVNLTSGAATLIGNIGNGAQPMGGLAVEIEQLPPPPLPTLSIGDITKAEGSGGGVTTFTFTVTRSGDTSGASTVNFNTADGSATQPADYGENSGQLTFGPGVTSQTLDVAVVADNDVEPDQAFVVNLVNPAGATIADAQATGTILNDDVAVPAFSIDDVTLDEGTGPGTTAFTFTVTRSGNLANPSTVTAQAANGTATAPADFFPAGPTVLNFGPGVPTQTFTVQVKHDAAPEIDEHFVVNLSAPTNGTITDAQGTGTILNDDVPPPPTPTVELGLDPAGKKALIITGTDAGEHFDVDPTNSTNKKVRVEIDGLSYGEFETSKFDRIVADLKGGDDQASISSHLSKDCFVFAGDGNDDIKTGSGRDVIVGGNDDDLLNGRKGRDVIIGGDGADTLLGSEDDDLLIAAATVYDDDFAGLAAIQKEWVSGSSYSSRVSHLKNGSGSNLGGRLLDDSTVLDDLFGDILIGNSGTDAFFVQKDNSGGSVKDTVTDKGGSESVVDVN